MLDKRYEMYMKIKGVYKFIGWYEMEKENKYMKIEKIKESKKAFFYKYTYLLTGEIEYIKYMKFDI